MQRSVAYSFYKISGMSLVVNMITYNFNFACASNFAFLFIEIVILYLHIENLQETDQVFLCSIIY